MSDNVYNPSDLVISDTSSCSGYHDTCKMVTIKEEIATIQEEKKGLLKLRKQAKEMQQLPYEEQCRIVEQMNIEEPRGWEWISFLYCCYTCDGPWHFGADALLAEINDALIKIRKRTKELKIKDAL